MSNRTIIKGAFPLSLRVFIIICLAIILYIGKTEAGSKSKASKTTVIAIDGGGGGSGKPHPVPIPWPIVHCHHHHHHMKYVPKPILIHHWVKKFPKYSPPSSYEDEHDHEHEHDGAGSEFSASNLHQHHSDYHQTNNLHDSFNHPHHSHHHHHHHQSSPHHHHHHQHPSNSSPYQYTADYGRPTQSGHKPTEPKYIGFEDPDMATSLLSEGLRDPGSSIAALASKLALDSTFNNKAPSKKEFRKVQFKKTSMNGVVSKKLPPSKLSIDADSGIDSLTNIALANKTDSILDRPIVASVSSSAPTETLISTSQQQQQQLLETIGTIGAVRPSQHLSNGAHSNHKLIGETQLANSIAANSNKAVGGAGWMSYLDNANTREQAEANKAYERLAIEQMGRMHRLENINRHQQLPGPPVHPLQKQQQQVTLAQSSSGAVPQVQLPQIAQDAAMLRQIPIQSRLQPTMPTMISAIGARMASTMSELHTIDLMTRMAAQMAQIEAKKLLASKHKPGSAASENKSKKTIQVSAKQSPAKNRGEDHSGARFFKKRNVFSLLSAPLSNLREKRRASLSSPITMFEPSDAQKMIKLLLVSSGPTLVQQSAPTKKVFDQLHSGAKLHLLRASSSSVNRNPRQEFGQSQVQSEVSKSSRLIPVTNQSSTSLKFQQKQATEEQLLSQASSSSEAFKVIELTPAITTTMTTTAASSPTEAPIAGASHETLPLSSLASSPSSSSSLSDNQQLPKNKKQIAQQQQQQQTIAQKSMKIQSSKSARDPDNNKEHLTAMESGFTGVPTTTTSTTTMSPEQESDFYARQREHLLKQQQQQRQQLTAPGGVGSSSNSSSGMYNSQSSNVHNSIADPSQPLNMNYSTTESLNLHEPIEDSREEILGSSLGPQQQQQRAFPVADAQKTHRFQQIAAIASTLSQQQRHQQARQGQQFQHSAPSTNDFYESQGPFGSINGPASEFVLAAPQEGQTYDGEEISERHYADQVMQMPSYLEFPLTPEQWSAEALRTMNAANSGANDVPSQNGDIRTTMYGELSASGSSAAQKSSSSPSVVSAMMQNQEEDQHHQQQVPFDFYSASATTGIQPFSMANQQRKLIFEQMVGMGQIAAIPTSQSQAHNEEFINSALPQQQTYQVVPSNNQAPKLNLLYSMPVSSSRHHFRPNYLYYSQQQEHQQQRQQQQRRQHNGRQQYAVMMQPSTTYYGPHSTKFQSPVYIRTRLPQSGSNHVATYVSAITVSQPNAMGQLYSTGSGSGGSEEAIIMPAQLLATSASSITRNPPLTMMTTVSPMKTTTTTSDSAASSPSVSYSDHDTVISGSVVSPPTGNSLTSSEQQFRPQKSTFFGKQQQQLGSSVGSSADGLDATFNAATQLTDNPIGTNNGYDIDSLEQTASNDMNRVRQFQTALSNPGTGAHNVTSMARLSKQLRNQMRGLQGRLPASGLPQMPNIPQPPQMPNLLMPPPGVMQMAGLALPFAMARATRQANRIRDQRVNSAANGGGTSNGGGAGQRFMSSIARISNRLFRPRTTRPGDQSASGSSPTGSRRQRPLGSRSRLVGAVQTVIDMSRRPPVSQATAAIKSPISSSIGGNSSRSTSSSTSSRFAIAAAAAVQSTPLAADKAKPKIDNDYDGELKWETNPTIMTMQPNQVSYSLTDSQTRVVFR